MKFQLLKKDCMDENLQQNSKKLMRITKLKNKTKTNIKTRENMFQISTII